MLQTGVQSGLAHALRQDGRISTAADGRNVNSC